MKSAIGASLILAGFLLPCSDAFGQSKFALSVTAAPFFGHTKSRVEAMLPDPNGSGTPALQVLRSESSPKGYWIGLGGRYSFSQKWSASTGLWFRNSVFKTSTGNSRSYQFSIPFIANFQASERKLSPYFSAGALWNFGTTSRVKIPDVGTVIFKSDRNTAKISPMVGAGVIYHFAQRLSLITQPTFSYAIPPSRLDINAYQLGLHVQLMLKL
ncbi:MAG: outer membrane beta-barrel protein [Dyadobacter sp.]|uniref:outer membrane beta-barrel protein n=1 Tax=Dyadobacter sp. TaxID=1914288 RepID=UPI0032647531